MSRARDIWRASQQARRIAQNPGVVTKLACRLPVGDYTRQEGGRIAKEIAVGLTLAAKSRRAGHVENWIEHMAWVRAHLRLGEAFGLTDNPAVILADQRRLLRRELARRRAA